MKLTDKLIEDAKKSQSGNENVLDFPTDFPSYKAFHAPTSDPQLRLTIWAKQMSLMPRYDLLYDVAHTGVGDFVGLIFPHMHVKMYGRNLNPLIEALSTHSVERICEYHPPFFQFAPGQDDGTLPCIEEIIIENAPMNPREEALSKANVTS